MELGTLSVLTEAALDRALGLPPPGSLLSFAVRALWRGSLQSLTGYVMLGNAGDVEAESYGNLQARVCKGACVPVT